MSISETSDSGKPEELLFHEALLQGYRDWPTDGWARVITVRPKGRSKGQRGGPGGRSVPARHCELPDRLTETLSPGVEYRHDTISSLPPMWCICRSTAGPALSGTVRVLLNPHPASRQGKDV